MYSPLEVPKKRNLIFVDYTNTRYSESEVEALEKEYFEKNKNQRERCPNLIHPIAQALFDIESNGLFDTLEINEADELISFCPSGRKFKIKDDLHLSADKIIELAPLCYGMVDKTIHQCVGKEEKKACFLRLLDTFLSIPTEKILKLNGVIDYEKDLILRAEGVVLFCYGIEHSDESMPKMYRKILSNMYLSPIFDDELLIKAMLTNADYFEGLREAFEIGFEVSMATINEARVEQDKTKKRDLVFRAILQMIFASHYLCLMFDPKHMRAPLKAMNDYLSRELVNTPEMNRQVITAIFIKLMQEQESGLFVKTDFSEPWEAATNQFRYGKETQGHLVTCIEVLFNNLALTYMDLPVPDNDDYRHYLPQIIKEQCHSPLLNVEAEPETNATIVKLRTTEPSSTAEYRGDFHVFCRQVHTLFSDKRRRNRRLMDDFAEVIQELVTHPTTEETADICAIL